MECYVQWGSLKDVLCLQNQVINSSERNLQDSYDTLSCLDSTYVNKDLRLPQSAFWFTSCSLTPSQSLGTPCWRTPRKGRSDSTPAPQPETEIQLLATASSEWDLNKPHYSWSKLASLFFSSLSPPPFAHQPPTQALGKITRALPRQRLAKALSGTAAKAPRNAVMLQVTVDKTSKYRLGKSGQS